MNRLSAVYDSDEWIGLAATVITVWAVLALSIFVLSVTGNNLGESTSSATRGAPWTPPGAFIGGVWSVLYTLMAISLWTANRLPVDQRDQVRPAILLLIVFCLIWPFYSFTDTSRWPGMLGNIGILAISLFVVWKAYPFSRALAFLVAPVALWISIAIASILDGARLYGW